MLRRLLIVCKVSLREKTELMGFTLYPVESPTNYGGDEEKNVHSLWRGV